jgi:hypothetical protein
MKKLIVTITLEMSVPDDWELFETSEGGQVIKMPDNQFLDIAIEPLFATDPEENWSTTEPNFAQASFIKLLFFAVDRGARFSSPWAGS